MNLQRLVKNLQRDIKANPKKGLVLLLLMVAGLYFWGPILKRWTLTAASQDNTPVIVQDDVRPTVKFAKKKKAAAWDKVDGALAQDQNASPLDSNQAALLNNPFIKSAMKMADVKVPGMDEEEEVEAPIEIPTITHFSPSEVGVIVTSVSIGPKGPLAFIQGRVYKVGDSIPLPVAEDKQDQPPLAPFEVKQIEPWGVLLERLGTVYSQKLPLPQLQKQDQIVWGGEGEVADEADKD